MIMLNFILEQMALEAVYKSVSVAHENISETSVYFTNIAFYSLHL